MRRRSPSPAAVLLLIAAFGGGCRPVESPCADPDDCRLDEAAAVAGVRFGFHDEGGVGGPGSELAAAEGNAATNHGVSWAALQPAPGVVTGSMDAACDYAEANDLFQVGFHFAWNQILLDDFAPWVGAITDPDALREVLRERVRTIFERCPGLDRLDVLNEPLAPLAGATVHENHFFQVLGPDYIAELFRIVREEAPPEVELFLNENFVEYVPERADAFFELVRGLVEGGAPVDAVGLQTHLLLGEPDFALQRDLMERLAALGVKVFLSELDVPVPRDLPDRFEVQAERYFRVVEGCLAVPACDTIIVWGIDDAHTWLDSFQILTGPDPDPLLFDDALAPKPAYFAVRDALLNGRGGDHPVGAESVSVRRLGGRTLLHLSSRDPLVVAPSPGSRNDPRHREFGSARVELRLAGSEIRTIELSRADRFAVHRGATVYLGSLFGGGEPVWLRLDEGDGLDLLLGDAPITPTEAAAGFAVTITLGTLRTCISVPPEPIATSPRGTFAEDVPKPEGWSCDAFSGHVRTRHGIPPDFLGQP